MASRPRARRGKPRSRRQTKHNHPTATVAWCPGLEKVLLIPELFENVLLQLPMRDLLLAQRVCKKWQRTIVSSPRLQEALFFKPASGNTSTTTFLSPTTSSSTLSSPLTTQLSLLSPHWSSNRATDLDPPSAATISNPTTATKRRQQFEPNPLLRKKFEPFFRTEITERWNPIRSEQLLDLPWNNKTERSRNAVTRSEASWRKMLLVQPASAVTMVDVIHTTSGRLSKTIRVPITVINPVDRGLRMGWIYDRCCETVFDPIGNFDLSWHMCHLRDDKWAPKLTINLWHVIQCLLGYSPDPADDAMWSQGYCKSECIEYRIDREVAYDTDDDDSD